MRGDTDMAAVESMRTNKGNSINNNRCSLSSGGSTCGTNTTSCSSYGLEPQYQRYSHHQWHGSNLADDEWQDPVPSPRRIRKERPAERVEKPDRDRRLAKVRGLRTDGDGQREAPPRVQQRNVGMNGKPDVGQSFQHPLSSQYTNHYRDRQPDDAVMLEVSLSSPACDAVCTHDQHQRQRRLSRSLADDDRCTCTNVFYQPQVPPRYVDDDGAFFQRFSPRSLPQIEPQYRLRQQYCKQLHLPLGKTAVDNSIASGNLYAVRYCYNDDDGGMNGILSPQIDAATVGQIHDRSVHLAACNPNDEGVILNNVPHNHRHRTFQLYRNIDDPYLTRTMERQWYRGNSRRHDFPHGHFDDGDVRDLSNADERSDQWYYQRPPSPRSDTTEQDGTSISDITSNTSVQSLSIVSPGRTTDCCKSALKDADLSGKRGSTGTMLDQVDSDCVDDIYQDADDSEDDSNERKTHDEDRSTLSFDIFRPDKDSVTASCNVRSENDVTPDSHVVGDAIELASCKTPPTERTFIITRHCKRDTKRVEGNTQARQSRLTTARPRERRVRFTTVTVRAHRTICGVGPVQNGPALMLDWKVTGQQTVPINRYHEMRRQERKHLPLPFKNKIGTVATTTTSSNANDDTATLQSNDRVRRFASGSTDIQNLQTEYNIFTDKYRPLTQTERYSRLLKNGIDPKVIKKRVLQSQILCQQRLETTLQDNLELLRSTSSPRQLRSLQKLQEHFKD